ncbi:DUF2628 domain-containing protein [Microvirga flavescens]|uniref:DUF2628 domain-containing protein n=1 Tax=Microvirga flavescens TaxID=2249811 RepID=UPI000DD591E0|nr:DUF2628 domain-containing protein [Microvirga flavescens]
MKTYVLHLPRSARPGDAGDLDKARTVKDGFSWGAFFFTFLWFFFHRLWLAGLLVLAAVIGLGFAMEAFNVHPAAGFLAQVLLSTLIGLEANSLRRWSLTRRGLPAVDVVRAHNRDEAETMLFARWLQRTPAAARQTTVTPAVTPATSPTRRIEPVIGLFPDAERPL